MTNREYRRMTAKQLRGRKVRARFTLKHHYGSIKADSILTIKGKRGGLDLETEHCDGCGVSFHIHGVDPYKVSLLPEGWEPPEKAL